jgi:hypothetical protein
MYNSYNAEHSMNILHVTDTNDESIFNNYTNFIHSLLKNTLHDQISVLLH